MSFRRMDSNGPRPGAAGANRQRVNEMIRVPQILVIAETGENTVGPVAAALQSALAKNGSADSTRDGPKVRSKSVPVSL